MTISPFKDRPGTAKKLIGTGSATTAFSLDTITRTVLAANQSGSDATVDIDHLRQGVEIINNNFRYTGTQPKLGSELDSNILNLNIFGVPKEFKDE